MNVCGERWCWMRLAGICAGLLASGAGAGVVTFDPPAIEVTLAERGLRTLEVRANPDSARFDAVTLLIGSDDVPIVAAWEPVYFGPGPFTASEGPLLTPDGPNVYQHEVYWGGNISPGSLAVDSIMLIYITVDLTDLAAGTHSLGVNTLHDGGVSGVGLRGAVEPLSGTLTLTIVPEPASLALVGLALGSFRLRCCRRRNWPIR